MINHNGVPMVELQLGCGSDGASSWRAEKLGLTW